MNVGSHAVVGLLLLGDVLCHSQADVGSKPAFIPVELVVALCRTPVQALNQAGTREY